MKTNRIKGEGFLITLAPEPVWMEDLGKKVKAKGRKGLEYGLVIRTDDEEQGNIGILWDTNKPNDIEGYLGGKFDDASEDYEFKFIDKQGNQVNRIPLEDLKPRRSSGDKKRRNK